MTIRLLAIGGVEGTVERALAFELRKVFAYEGLPIILKPEDIKRTKSGWEARAQLKRTRHTPLPVTLVSDHPMAACARAPAFKFCCVDRLLIAPKND